MKANNTPATMNEAITNELNARNAREHWLDVQARALYQAANLVANIAAKYINA